MRDRAFPDGGAGNTPGFRRRTVLSAAPVRPTEMRGEGGTVGPLFGVSSFSCETFLSLGDVCAVTASTGLPYSRKQRSPPMWWCWVFSVLPRKNQYNPHKQQPVESTRWFRSPSRGFGPVLSECRLGGCACSRLAGVQSLCTAEPCSPSFFWRQGNGNVPFLGRGMFCCMRSRLGLCRTNPLLVLLEITLVTFSIFTHVPAAEGSG